MVNRRTRADRKAKNRSEKDDANTRDSENDGDINESSDNILDDSVIEENNKKVSNKKKKKSTDTEKSEKLEKVVRKTRRSLRSTDTDEELGSNKKDSVANDKKTEDKKDDDKKDDETLEISIDPIQFNHNSDESDLEKAKDDEKGEKPNGDPLVSQSDENEKSPENDDSEKDINDEAKDDDASQKDDDQKPAIGLRLVPLNLLLRQDILNKQEGKKTSTRSSRKSSTRNRKRTSYIEISSGEDDQISVKSSSSESVNNISSSDDDDEALSSLRRNTRKNNSTNSKLSNGTKSVTFKEPMSPTKLMKNAKTVSINLEKMPDNVNKLMKCYRVNDDPIALWSESDDFENMISTSKIDRVALDKTKQEQEKQENVPVKPREVRQVRPRKSEDSEREKSEKEKPDKVKPEKEKSEKKSLRKSENKKQKRDAAPTRTRSTRNAALNRRQIIENESSESEDESSDGESEDETTLKPVEKNKNAKNGKAKKGQTSESEVEKDQNQSTSKEQSENESVKNDKSKEKDSDDHSKEKSPKKIKKQESSSDEDEKEKSLQVRSSRSSRNAKDQNAAKTSKSDSKTTPDKKSSSKNEKTSNLKITISLNQKKVINHSNDNIEDLSKSDSDISSKSKDNPKTKAKTKNANRKKISSDTSDSEDEPLELLKNKSKEDIDTKSNYKDSDLSDNEKSADEETSTTSEQKLRNRNKYEANKDFNKLKELIERKKKSKPKSDSEDENTKDSVRNNDKGKENHDENGEKETITKASSKRKRLLSSSEEENEDDDKKKSSSKSDLETPAKKRKKKMDDDSDYNEESAGEEENEKNSESESSDEDIGKKRKGKRSSEDDEDLDELEKGRGKGKSRKRIKKITSSDEDGDDEKGKKASGRKTIRKIIRNDKLDVSTKEAAKIERERKQRIEERQKSYNQFYDERPEEIKEITQLVLDFDEETKDSLLQVDKKLVKKLKPHQANGVKFMFDACFESLERCKNDVGSGCILAHCMGLGKTLQVITLVHTLITNSDDTDVTRALVVCPLNTVLNWVNEFKFWLKGIKGSEDIEIYEINKLKQNIDRANKLMEWHNEGGVMILSYDMFRNLTNDQNNRLRKKIKESLQTSLIDPGPDLVICDEGHLLKNEKTSISKCMMKLRTVRRIVLTGTPLQNNLKEYFCMVQFVKPNLLGKYQEYMNRFVNPITNGQYTDSTEYDIQVMRRRAHVLHKMLDGCVQRRDYSVLAPFLPPKHEYVLSIKLSSMQARLYKHYMESKARQNEESNRKGSILFQDFQNLQRIWSAPKALRYNSDRYEIEMQRKRDLESEDESEGSIKDFIDDSESAESTSSSSDGSDAEHDDQSIHSDEKKKKKKKKDGIPPIRRTRATAAACPQVFEEEEEEIAVSSKLENPTEWWTQICPEEELNNIEHSSKLMLLMSILEKCEAIGDKLLVFSQSLYSLDVIEHFLNYIDDQTQHNIENASFKASWTLGQDYFRLDGSTPVEQRNSACKHFNSPDNPRARLFLISTRAGGLGINLVAANRVVIFDVSWNPSHDIQSIFRVYRFGQTKPCYVYRFIALGTMEEKIYERQVTKQAISKRVIDEQQIDRHYNQNDLQELYKYELEPDDEVREIPLLPKDRLFAEMLQKYEDMIWKYHEHDTLLENKEEETLNEDERKQAWEEFEQEKTRPQFVSFYPQQQQQQRTGPVTSNNIFGIRTDILLKLLSMKARLDNPSFSEANVKHAIPLLMQELYRQMDRGELTLYQQLLALSSSLEAPTNYGGKFHVNEARMHQTYNDMHSSLPSTSTQALNLYRSQLVRQQNLATALQNRSQQIRRISDTVIEID